MRTEDGPPQHPSSTVHSTHRKNTKIRLENEFTQPNKRLQELKEDFEITETK